MMEHFLQDQVLELQKKKDLARRQRNQERALRFLDVKSRTIGIDKEFLDQQLLEKQQRRKQEEDYNKNEISNGQELCKYLNERDAVTSLLRNKEVNEIKDTLMKQMLLPKNNAIGQGTPLIVDQCTASSIQKFSGEDLEYHDRRKMQQEQLKRWCDQSIVEKHERIRLEKLSEQNLAQQLLYDDARSVCRAQEEEILQKNVQKDIQQENLKLHKLRYCQHFDNKPIDPSSTTLLSEISDDTTLCHFQQQNKMRPDHFKGYSKEALSLIRKENDDVVMSKRQKQLMEENDKNNWEQYQKHMLREQEINAILQQEMKRNQSLQNADFLEQQRQEQKMNREFLNTSRFGFVASEFFECFGTSCR